MQFALCFDTVGWWQEGHPACKKLSGGYCLEQGANDLHMVQLMPLPPIISCSSKIQNGLPFWCWLTQWRIQSFSLGRARWRAREREPITGVWGRSPQRSPGAEHRVRGALRPPEAEKLFSLFHWNVQRRGYSRHFSCSVGVVDGDSGQGDYSFFQLSRILTAK